MFVGFWRGVAGACFEVEEEVEAGLWREEKRVGGIFGGEKGKEKVSEWDGMGGGDVLTGVGVRCRVGDRDEVGG